MKRLVILSFLFSLPCLVSFSQRKTLKTSNMNSKEVEAIIKATEDFQEAWNKGDAKAAALFYTEDAIRVGAFGDVQHGIAEIEAAYEKLLHQTMAGASVKQERGNVRILTEDLAIWDAPIEINIPGNSEPLKGYVVQVMKKLNGKWMVLEAHPKIFPKR
jgi:uncharacterized protein (TIGR02246 family)